MAIKFNHETIKNTGIDYKDGIKGFRKLLKKNGFKRNNDTYTLADEASNIGKIIIYKRSLFDLEYIFDIVYKNGIHIEAFRLTGETVEIFKQHFKEIEIEKTELEILRRSEMPEETKVQNLPEKPQSKRSSLIELAKSARKSLAGILPRKNTGADQLEIPEYLHHSILVDLSDDSRSSTSSNLSDLEETKTQTPISFQEAALKFIKEFEKDGKYHSLTKYFINNEDPLLVFLKKGDAQIPNSIIFVNNNKFINCEYDSSYLYLQSIEDIEVFSQKLDKIISKENLGNSNDSSPRKLSQPENKVERRDSKSDKETKEISTSQESSDSNNSPKNSPKASFAITVDSPTSSLVRS